MRAGFSRKPHDLKEPQMRRKVSNALAVGIGMAVTQLAAAGTATFFNPLTQSAVVSTPDSAVENNHPWLVPPGVTQINLTSMEEIEADIAQSVIRAPGAGTSASMWDMLAYDDEGENVFIPHETPWGAGASRYNIAADTNAVLFEGDSGGLVNNWANDWGAFDPATFTPNGTLLLGEEWTAEGRIIEVLNPHAPVADIEIRELQSIANTSHEALQFADDGSTLYFIDEWNSGSIYKIVFNNPADYADGGQTFVLSVDAFAGDPAANYNEGINNGSTRTGPATWVPITDANGVPLTPTDPFANGPTDDPRFNPATRGGRGAADDAGGTPYGRPEDGEVSTLASGNAVFYFAATSENRIYSVEELGGDSAFVRVFASGATPRNLGFLPTTGVLNSPDNLALDALGNIYIIEDAPNSDPIGGDIWFARDENNDGVAESLDHFMSIQADGSESTGMIFNPVNPTEFVVAVQHPDSTGIMGDFGDAMWSFDLTNVVPPSCVGDPGPGAKFCNKDKMLFAKMLKRAAKKNRR
jgi:hypothetical protein